jgi:hypothetical protein
MTGRKYSLLVIAFSRDVWVLLWLSPVAEFGDDTLFNYQRA